MSTRTPVFSVGDRVVASATDYTSLDGPGEVVSVDAECDGGLVWVVLDNEGSTMPEPFHARHLRREPTV